MPSMQAQGTVLSIGGKGAASPEPTWVQVGELKSLGDLQFNIQEQRSTALDRNTDDVLKGILQTPVVAMTFNRWLTDEGQEDLKAAFEDRAADQQYWFKVELSDAPDAGTPTTYWFKAKCLSWTPLGGIAEGSIVVGGASLAIDYETIVEIEAAA